MIVAHKVALDPNDKQRTYFARASGVARFAYNWALGEWQRQYQMGGKPTEMSLRVELNKLKRQQFPWMLDVTKFAIEDAIINVGMAFRAFFEKRQGYPQIKKRGKRDSFCAARDARKFRCDGRHIRLPIIGWVRMREPVRFSGVLRHVTVSRRADRWFASVIVDTQDFQPVQQPEKAVGVDLGLKRLAVFSQGDPITGPKAFAASLKRLRRASRALSRKQLGSCNRAKARQRLARLHARIANIRKDVTHKATTHLVKTYRRIGVEHLNVRGMRRNRGLGRSVMDAALYEFRRQLEYKAPLYGADLIVADRWYPSSKTCSSCGFVIAVLDLSQRIFRCPKCGFECDRDDNAALNLEYLAASSAVTACGEERSGAVRKSRVKRASVKQEPNGKAELSLRLARPLA
jgi:putative transposase